MKFEGQNIIFNKVLSRISLFQDMDLGEMGPNFQSTVYCLYYPSLNNGNTTGKHVEKS